jgi:hypothetical protein
MSTKPQVRCESCKRSFSDVYLALWNHSKSCANKNARRVEHLLTLKDMFPHSALGDVLKTKIVTLHSKNVFSPLADDAEYDTRDSDVEYVTAFETSETQSESEDTDSDPENATAAPVSHSQTSRIQPAKQARRSPQMPSRQARRSPRKPSPKRRGTATSKAQDKEDSDYTYDSEEEEEEEREEVSPNTVENRRNTSKPRRNSARFEPPSAPHPDITSAIDLAYTNEPTDAQIEGLTTLITNFSDGAFNIPNGYVKTFGALTDKILVSSIQAQAQHDELTLELSVAAWQLLPGLVTRMQRLKHEKLHDLLRSWHQHETPHKAIIQYAQQIQRQHPFANRGKPSNKLTEDRATELIKAGRFGALMRAIEQEQGDGPVRQSNQVMADLAAPLHPRAAQEHDNIDDIQADDDTHNISFTIHELAKSITTLPEVSASGASGWTFKLLRQLYKKEAHSLLNANSGRRNQDQENIPAATNANRGLYLLLQLYTMILSRQFNPRMMDRILMARLILLPKPNGGTRPIAIGDSILRLMLRVINTKVAKIVGKKLEPLQVAVGTSGGCEIMAALVQYTLEQGYVGTNQNEHRAVQTIDLPNAFNGVHRRSIATGLREHCPELLDLFKLTYASRSELRAHTSDGRGQLIGYSEKGCRQGDPLSMLYFAVAVHPALVKIQATLDDAHAESTFKPRAIAYADDIALCGDPQVIINSMSDISHHLVEATGLAPNIRKCTLLGTGSSTVSRPSSLLDLKTCVDGGEIVGVPVGTAAHRTSLSTDKIGEQAASIVLVTKNRAIDEQTKLSLLKFCVNTKPNYLRRNVDTALTQEALSTFDSRIDCALESLSGCALNDTAKALRSLPIKLGGVGIQRHSGPQSLNDYRSRNTLISTFAGQHLAELAQALSDTSAVNAMDRDSQEHANNILAADMPSAHKQTHRELLARTVLANTEEGAKLNAHIRSGTQTDTPYSTSGDWTNWMGGSDQRNRMKPQVFVNALRTRLGLPVCNEHLGCVNRDIHHTRHQDDTVDLHESFMHTVLCQPAFGVSKALKNRHDYVRDALHDLIKDTALQGMRAPPIEALAKERKVGEIRESSIVADLIWNENHDTARRHRHVFDVTVVEPCSQQGIGQDTGHAAASAAADKLNLYSEVSREENTSFIPFALESNGHVGKHASDFLQALSERDPSFPSRIAQFLKQVSFILAKQTAIASEAGRTNALKAKASP